MSIKKKKQLKHLKTNLDDSPTNCIDKRFEASRLNEGARK